MAIYWGEGESPKWRDLSAATRKGIVGAVSVVTLVLLAVFWEQVYAAGIDFVAGYSSFIRGLSMPADSAEYLSSRDTLSFLVTVGLLTFLVIVATRLIEGYEEFKDGGFRLPDKKGRQ
ncbi:MAG: hypothetical protein ACM3NH_01855 [Candidatus Saccharibacteria bacterium]